MSGPGEVTIRIDALPDAGDVARYGDGKGRIIDLEWTYGGEAFSLGATVPGEYLVLVPLVDAGQVLPISVRAVSDLGPGPWSAPVMVPVAGDPSIYFVFAAGAQVYDGADQVAIVLSVGA
ncbi:glycoside hydrolase family 43 protein [Amaricoccus solimangrovi]|uniref:Glycoside hydrolase family 43 protein n=1 Tax=Amaricoccus solimangrovi TaxID=2589815 RepID=A0A501WWI5_9RHOB|nr:glycoside hydrolase family 43 protein [Amaricoccus solimangrovi]TPE53082.1 glycoside hydrolase family 43 protein [Amaricoccus solimangrovi]